MRIPYKCQTNVIKQAPILLSNMRMIYLPRPPWTRCSYKSFASRRSCNACSAISSLAKLEVIMNTASLHSTVLPLPSVSRPFAKKLNSKNYNHDMFKFAVSKCILNIKCSIYSHYGTGLFSCHVFVYTGLNFTDSFCWKPWSLLISWQ